MHPSIDLEPDALVPPSVVRTAGLALVAAGLFGAGGAVQVLAVFDGVGHTLLALPVLLASAAAMLVGPYAYDGRSWAPFAGALLAALVGALSFGWLVYGFLWFVFAPALLLAIGGAVGALLVLPFAIGPSLRVSAARRALAA